MKGAALVLLAAAALGSPALAGYQVDQRVVYTMGGTTGPSDLQFTWQVTERLFRLDVKHGADARSFVFNGRVFYVCGRLDKALLAQAKSTLTDPALLASLEKGACQELPTDFTMKFFMSPFAALTEVDVAGGINASLEFQDPHVELSGTLETIRETKCVGFSRSYQLVSKDKQGGSETVSEKACNASGIHWRGALARELGMMLLRQPRGRQYYQILTQDMKAMAGLTLSSTGQVVGQSSTGAAFSRTFEVVTTAVQERTQAPAELGLPEGYEVIDPNTHGGLANRRTPTPTLPSSKPGVLFGFDVPLLMIYGLFPH